MKEKQIKFGLEMPESIYKLLQKIARYYRTNGNLSHAARMLIEDAAKGLEKGDMISRVKDRKIHLEGEER